MLLTQENYFSKEANTEYMSVSQFKAFEECEAQALNNIEISGENETTAFLEGKLFEAWVSGDRQLFMSKHPELISSRGPTAGQLKAEFNKVIKEFSCNEMSQFFNDKSNKIFHCHLVWHNMYTINYKGTLIIFETNIKIYKMNIKKGQKGEKSGIFFDLVEVINNENIYDILRDNNVFNLHYKTGNKNNDLRIDTYSDRDGDIFYSNIKEIVKKNGKGDAVKSK